MSRRKGDREYGTDWFRDEIADPMLIAAVEGARPTSILSKWALRRLQDGSIDGGQADHDDGYHAEIWWVNCANGYAWLVSREGEVATQINDEEMYPRVAIDAIGVAEGVIRDLRLKEVQS